MTGKPERSSFVAALLQVCFYSHAGSPLLLRGMGLTVTAPVPLKSQKLVKFPSRSAANLLSLKTTHSVKTCDGLFRIVKCKKRHDIPETTRQVFEGSSTVNFISYTFRNKERENRKINADVAYYGQ